MKLRRTSTSPIYFLVAILLLAANEDLGIVEAKSSFVPGSSNGWGIGARPSLAPTSAPTPDRKKIKKTKRHHKQSESMDPPPASDNAVHHTKKVKTAKKHASTKMPPGTSAAFVTGKRADHPHSSRHSKKAKKKSKPTDRPRASSPKPILREMENAGQPRMQRSTTTKKRIKTTAGSGALKTVRKEHTREAITDTQTKSIKKKKSAKKISAPTPATVDERPTLKHKSHKKIKRTASRGSASEEQGSSIKDHGVAPRPKKAKKRKTETETTILPTSVDDSQESVDHAKTKSPKKKRKSSKKHAVSASEAVKPDVSVSSTVSGPTIAEAVESCVGESAKVPSEERIESKADEVVHEEDAQMAAAMEADDSSVTSSIVQTGIASLSEISQEEAVGLKAEDSHGADELDEAKPAEAEIIDGTQVEPIISISTETSTAAATTACPDDINQVSETLETNTTQEDVAADIHKEAEEAMNTSSAQVEEGDVEVEISVEETVEGDVQPFADSIAGQENKTVSSQEIAEKVDTGIDDDDAHSQQMSTTDSDHVIMQAEPGSEAELPKHSASEAMADEEELTAVENEDIVPTAASKEEEDVGVLDKSSDVSETNDEDMEEYEPTLLEHHAQEAESSSAQVLTQNISGETKPESDGASVDSADNPKSGDEATTPEDDPYLEKDTMVFIGKVLNENVSSWIRDSDEEHIVFNEETSDNSNNETDFINGTRGGSQSPEEESAVAEEEDATGGESATMNEDEIDDGDDEGGDTNSSVNEKETDEASLLPDDPALSKNTSADAGVLEHVSDEDDQSNSVNHIENAGDDSKTPGSSNEDSVETKAIRRSLPQRKLSTELLLNLAKTLKLML